MSKWKPFFNVKTSESLRAYRNGKSKSQYITVEAPTYRELKKLIPEYVKPHTDIDETISISRSRRGEWGEWFEVWGWSYTKNKPTILRQGWE